MTSALPSPIRSPGVDVVQSIRRPLARMVNPILNPVIVGPSFRIMELTNEDGSLNEEARIVLPALYQPINLIGVATAATATVPAGVTETVSIAANGGTPFTVDFDSGTYTMADVAKKINDEAAVKGSPIRVEVVSLSSTNSMLRIRSLLRGNGASLEVAWSTSATTPVIPTTFLIPVKWRSTGYTQYGGERLFVTKDLLPDPWNLGVDLDIIESSVRGFLTGVSNIKKELSRAQTVNRTVNSTLVMEDDLDGDGTTPFLVFRGNASATPAVPNDVVGQNALPQLPAGKYGTLEFTATNEIIRTVGSWIDDGYGVPGTKVVIALSTSNNGTFTVVSATNTTLTVSETTVAEGPSATETVNGYSYPDTNDDIVNFSAVSSRATVKTTCSWPLPAGTGGSAAIHFDLSVDGWPTQRIAVNTGTGTWSAADVAAEINRYFPGVADVDGGQVRIRSQFYGREGVIRIGAVTIALPVLTSTQYGTLAFTAGPNEIVRTAGSWVDDGYAIPGTNVVIAGATTLGNNTTWTVVSATATNLTVTAAPAVEGASTTETVTGYRGTNMLFGFAVGNYPMVIRGGAQPIAVGDEIWVDGQKLAAIAELTSVGAGVDQKVKLDTEYKVDRYSTGEAHNWFIVSKNLTSQFGAGSSDRATPEMTVDEYIVQFRHDELLGAKAEPMYRPITPSDVKAYGAVFYKGLRLDVTASARTRDPVPVQIRANDFTSLEDQFAPLTAENPLGLAGYFGLLNSGDSHVYLFGVDEVSDAYPEGTPAAYARAFAALKSMRCYGIAPLSQDLDVALSLHSHVRYMSATKRRNERYGFVTFPIPTRAEPTLVGSATSGNSGDPGGASPWTFETGLPDLADLFQSAGISSTGGWGPMPAGDGTEVYLNIEGDTNNYMVTGYSGSTITCRKRSASEDTFYSASLWPAAIVDKSFSIFIRGHKLVDLSGNPDRQAIAIAMGRRCTRFADRRMVVGAPGEFEAPVGGVVTRLPSYYLAAIGVCARCASHPSKPLTNAPLVGVTRVLYSNGYFSEEDMDQAAGFGLWWWKNDEVTGNVVTRQQLTTDPTSVKTREDSIRTAVDFGSYAIRDTMAPIMGTLNITDASLDMLSIVIDGILKFLTTTGVWRTAEVVTLQQGPFDATPEDLAEGLGPGEEDEVLLELDVTASAPMNRMRVRIVI